MFSCFQSVVYLFELNFASSVGSNEQISWKKKTISQGELTEYVYDKGTQLVMCTRGIRALWLDIYAIDAAD